MLDKQGHERDRELAVAPARVLAFRAIAVDSGGARTMFDRPATPVNPNESELP